MSDGQEMPLPPGSVIGILGGGQLGRMLASAAAKLGFKVHIYCPDEKSPAAEVAVEWTRAAYEDEAALARFANAVDLVTYEFENVPVATAEFLLRAGVGVHPGAKALEVAQDRLTEKRFMKSLGIDTAPFMPVASEEALGMAMNVTGLPAILKTRRFGYDGKGQAVVHEEAEAATGWEELGHAPTIMEGFVAFEREVSVICVRGRDGQTAAYDVAENTHADGILHRSVVPAAGDKAVQRQAIETAARIAAELDYVGVLAVEFFAEKSGHLRVNEIAPRVHNSGHWTVEACFVSQFENHIRAICGWPLGTTARHHDCEMENLLGEEAADWHARLEADARSFVTLYGKKEMRAGRKMGHVVRLKDKTGA